MRGYEAPHCTLSRLSNAQGVQLWIEARGEDDQQEDPGQGPKLGS